MIILALKVCSILNGNCEQLEIKTDTHSIQACYLGAPHIIAATYPELLDEQGMGDLKLKLKSYECRNS